MSSVSSNASEFPFLTNRLSRRALVAGSLATGGLLAVGLRRAAIVAAASFAAGDDVVTTAAVNFRDAPGLSSNVLIVLPEGQTAVVQGDGIDKDGYTWYLIKTVTGVVSPTGYVAGTFLELSGGSDSKFSSGDQVVTTSAVNYRSAPGLNSTVYVVLPEGSYAVVQDSGTYQDGYTWYLVRTSTGGPSPTGYIAGDFLELGSPAGGKFNTGDWVYVNSGPLNFRSSPGLSGSVIRTLQTNDIGQVVMGPEDASGYTWYEIEVITGDVGWVVQDFLTAGDPPPPSGGVSVGDTIKVVDGPLNIRSGPGSSYGAIDTAATGATATVTDGPTSANGYTWIKINGNQLAVGWVAFEFCTVA